LSEKNPAPAIQAQEAAVLIGVILDHDCRPGRHGLGADRATERATALEADVETRAAGRSQPDGISGEEYFPAGITAQQVLMEGGLHVFMALAASTAAQISFIFSHVQGLNL
jgi:hypothetical protein